MGKDQTIKAIPTNYNGRDYRSRTEARWALFFDLLDIPFQYEPQKVPTGVSNYVPDFVLPTLKTIFEVKGTDPTPVELERLADIHFSGEEYNASERVIAAGVPGKTLLSVTRLYGSILTFGVHLNQCLYCGGYGWYWDSSTDDSNACSWKHGVCDAAYEIHRELDIDYDFYSAHSGYGEKPPHPGVSPAVKLALETAESIAFDQKNFYEIVEIHKRAQKVLREAHVFSDSRFIHNLYRYLLSNRRNKDCPRFFGTHDRELKLNDRRFEMFTDEELDDLLKIVRERAAAAK